MKNLCITLILSLSAFFANAQTWSAVGTGMDNSVYALCVYNTEFYAGGFFGTAGGNSAHGIARWNGTNWSPVGAGIMSPPANYGRVLALGIYNSELYAGGGFNTAGGNSVSNIAGWNGTTWSALGAGMNNGGVYALATYNSELYAGVGLLTVPQIILPLGMEPHGRPLELELMELFWR